MSRSRRSLSVPASTLLAAVLVPGLALAQAGAGGCGCDDVDDLLNRIDIANAAINKYNMEAAAIGPTVMTDGGGTPNNYLTLQNSVLAAQTEVQNAAARDASGDTDGITCTTQVKAPTACLREIVDFHESLHRTRCTADRARRKLGTFGDRMAGQPLSEMVLEEIAAYEREIQEALRRLRAMPASCRPKGWTGTITVLEVKRLNITQENPPPAGNRVALGGTSSSDQNVSRFGTIWYRDTKVTGYIKSEQIQKQSTVARLRVACTGNSLATKEPDRVQTDTYQAEIEDRGFTKDIPAVSIAVDEAQRSYTIDFTVPAIPAESGAATMTGFTSSAGGCKDETKPFPPAMTTSSSLDATPLTLTGRTLPGSKDVAGSQSFDMMPAGGLPGVTGMHRIEVRWNLHQLD